jgi:hypothetical protein
MQNQQRHTLVRRVLFPYGGEDPLSRRQGLRVILLWALLFPVPLSLCTLALCIAEAFTWHRTALLFLFTFLSGVVIFSVLAWFAVSMSNRAARIHQDRKARRGYR